MNCEFLLLREKDIYSMRITRNVSDIDSDYDEVLQYLEKQILITVIILTQIKISKIYVIESYRKTCYNRSHANLFST